MSATLTTAAPAATSKPLNIALWVLQIAAAAMLGMAGFQKLSSALGPIRLKRVLHSPSSSRYSTNFSS